LENLEATIQQFFELENEQISTISSYFKFKKLNKGDFFAEVGKNCNELAFIKSG